MRERIECSRGLVHHDRFAGSEPTMITDTDLERLRADTPGVAHVLHLNNAAAALPPRPVLEAMTEHLTLEATIGAYEAEASQEEAVLRPYRALAQLLNCDRREIAILENATRAWDLAFYSLPLERGDRILTGMNEYASNYIALLHAQRRLGVEVTAIPDDEHGQIDVAALADAIDDRTRLIALTHVPTNGGLVNPAVEVGRVAREAGVTYLLDACQSVGQMPLDVEEIGCDLLSGTARKFLRGPRGVGFLYARRELAESIEPMLLDLRAAEWTAIDDYEIVPGARRFETWEGNIAAKIALGVAVDLRLRRRPRGHPRARVWSRGGAAGSARRDRWRDHRRSGTRALRHRQLAPRKRPRAPHPRSTWRAGD